MKIELPNKEYDIIYADPAWKYNFSPSKYFSIEYHYPTMNIKDIKRIPIKSKKNSGAFRYGVQTFC